MIPHNMKGQDLIRATDFNFLMVLGKGKLFFIEIILLFTNKDVSDLETSMDYFALPGRSCGNLFSRLNSLASNLRSLNVFGRLQKFSQHHFI
jgi:hypothetical protein